MENNHELTTEEKQFIVQALSQLPLSGKPAQLRQAIDLIESITAKLEQGNDNEPTTS